MGYPAAAAGLVFQQGLSPVPSTSAPSQPGDSTLQCLCRSPVASPWRLAGIHSPGVVGGWALHGRLQAHAAEPATTPPSGERCRLAQRGRASRLPHPCFSTPGACAQLETKGQSPAWAHLQDGGAAVALGGRRSPQTIPSCARSTPSQSGDASRQPTGRFCLCAQGQASRRQAPSRPAR